MFILFYDIIYSKQSHHVRRSMFRPEWPRQVVVPVGRANNKSGALKIDIPSTPPSIDTADTAVAGPSASRRLFVGIGRPHK